MSEVAFTYGDAYYLFENKCKLIKHINEIFPQLYEPYADGLINELEQLKKNTGTALEEIEHLNFIRLMEPDFGLNAYKEYPLSPIAQKLRDELSDKSIFIYGSEIFLREMSLAYLITIFEDFLYDILQLHYIRYPDNLEVTLSQREEDFANGDMDKIEGMRINKEIKETLSQNVDILNNNLVRKFNLNFSSQRNWNEFLECYEHRHVIIHKDGSPDDKYKSRTEYSGDMGQRLPTTKEYITKSLTIFQNFAKITRDHFVENYPFYDRFSSNVPTENS